jgi:hypothetical protein
MTLYRSYNDQPRTHWSPNKDASIHHPIPASRVAASPITHMSKPAEISR